MALFMLASRFSDVLDRSTLKMTAAQSKVLAVVGMIILCVLSYSLFASLSINVVLFLVALVVISIVYVNTYAGKVTIENDLMIDYSAQKKE